jgi:hypothetical protein
VQDGAQVAEKGGASRDDAPMRHGIRFSTWQPEAFFSAFYHEQLLPEKANK